MEWGRRRGREWLRKMKIKCGLSGILAFGSFAHSGFPSVCILTKIFLRDQLPAPLFLVHLETDRCKIRSIILALGTLAQNRDQYPATNTKSREIIFHIKHGASLYLKFEGLNLSVVIIFKTFHWLKNFESCSVVSVARCQCCFASEK